MKSPIKFTSCYLSQLAENKCAITNKISSPLQAACILGTDQINIDYNNTTFLR